MIIKVKAFAKINLMLDILSRLDNGYHDLFMIMQSVGIYDTVTVEKNNLVSGLALFAELAHDAVCRPEARERAHSAILLECACPARRDLRLLFPSRLAARLV